MDDLRNAQTEGLSFGAWVRRQRKRLDLTQDALADAVGCAVATIRRIEAEERRPSRPMAQRFAMCLQIPEQHHEIIINWARTGRLTLLQPSAPTEAPELAITLAWTPTRESGGQNGFFGREQDIAGITKLLLQDTPRLLTVTGAPGIGKTQLGLRICAALGQHFPDGIAVIDLASVMEVRLVSATIAQVLRLRDQAEDTLLDALIHHLRDQRMLLMLDNFEHLLEASGLVLRLLETAPRLKILVTSRAPLRVSLEKEWPLAPLEVPKQIDAPFDVLAASPSVALFAARAVNAQPSFNLNPSNSVAVATICKQLDGIPLAIELAAAWTPILTPAEIAARIGQPFAFLKRRPHDWPPRHQTLWDTITWSYGLLDPDEQRLLQRLSVFPAAFSLDAALTVGADESGDSFIVLEQLGHLVDHSLVWRSCASEGASIFGLLEIIRVYSRDQLRIQGDENTLHQRHGAYYCTIAETAATELIGPNQAQWLTRLDSDYPHLRSAMRWAIDQHQGELAARIACALWRFWHLRGTHIEGRLWLEEVLTLRDTLPDPLAAQVLNSLGQALLEQARYADAEQRFTDALVVQRRLDNPMGVARILNNLGMIAESQSNYDHARRFHEESLAIKRTLDNPLATANSLNNLGIVLEAQGLYEEAWAMLEEGLNLRRAHGDHWSAAVSLLNLAQVAYLQGKPYQSLRLLQESLELRQKLNDITGIPWVLEGIANAISAQGNWRSATQLWGCAARLRAELGSPLPPSQQALNNQNLDLARMKLGDEFALAWSQYEGRSHTEIVLEALTLCEIALMTSGY